MWGTNYIYRLWLKLPGSGYNYIGLNLLMVKFIEVVSMAIEGIHESY